jgi:hypothetical protein
LIMVWAEEAVRVLTLGTVANGFLGVDACNTTLEVLLFAAAMNLGQGWATILTLFGCMSPSRKLPDLLERDHLGRNEC